MIFGTKRVHQLAEDQRKETGMLKSMKKRLAIILAAATLATSTGVTSLAEVFHTAGDELEGELGTDYRLVTLETQEGKFSQPMEYRLVSTADEGPGVGVPGDGSETASPGDAGTASPADPEPASPGNSTATPADPDGETPDEDVEEQVYKLVKKEGEGKTTTFAVTGTLLTEEDVNTASESAGLEQPANSTGIVWLTKKDDPTSEVDWENGLLLTEDKTTLYAGWIKNAAVTGTALEGGSMTYLGPENVSLSVADLAEKLDAEGLKAAVEATKEQFSNLDAASAIQLDVKNTGTALQADQSVLIRVTLPDSFKKAAEGRSMVVLHEGKNGWEAPKVTENKENGAIEFALKDFSPVIIALADEFAYVTLKNVPGGIGIVAEYKWDLPNDRLETITYLPVDEAVPVPVGTILVLNGYPYDYDKVQCESFSVSYADKTEVVDESYLEITSSMGGSVTITPVFKEGSSSDDGGADTWIEIEELSDTLKGGNKYNAVVTLQQNGRTVAADNWKLVPNNSVNDLFELTPEGKLTSKEPLEAGGYWVGISCEHNGKTTENYIYVVIGCQVFFDFMAGVQEDGNFRIFGDDAGLTIADYGTLFSQAKSAADLPEIKVFGDKWNSDGWYRYQNGQWTVMNDSDKITDHTVVYARFKDAEGNFYNPIVKPLSGAGTDDNNGDNNGNNGGNNSGNNNGTSSSHRSSGGSSGSSMNYNLYGTWVKDDIGWWFNPVSGGYPVNRWAVINGSWYYFGADGYMETGWLLWNGEWYYLNPEQGDQEGQMKTGWVYDRNYESWFYLGMTGKMETDWKQIQGAWYYLNPFSDGRKGTMAANTWIGNYFVDSNGVWLKDAVK